MGVLLDLSKALATHDKPILLDKLSHCGINGAALSWLRSYLWGWRQYVRVNDEGSSLISIDLGVALLSSLSPFLLIIFINDLVRCYSILKRNYTQITRRFTFNHQICNLLLISSTLSCKTLLIGCIQIRYHLLLVNQKNVFRRKKSSIEKFSALF